jgi:hypothetical protein
MLAVTIMKSFIPIYIFPLLELFYLSSQKSIHPRFLLWRSYSEMPFILLLSDRAVFPEECGNNFYAAYRIMLQLMFII